MSGSHADVDKLTCEPPVMRNIYNKNNDHTRTETMKHFSSGTNDYDTTKWLNSQLYIYVSKLCMYMYCMASSNTDQLKLNCS